MANPVNQCFVCEGPLDVWLPVLGVHSDEQGCQHTAVHERCLTNAANRAIRFYVSQLDHALPYQDANIFFRLRCGLCGKTHPYTASLVEVRKVAEGPLNLLP